MLNLLCKIFTLENTLTYKFSKLLMLIFFGIAFVLAISELFSIKTIITLLKPLLIPVLMVLYLYTSAKRNLLYVFSLLFAWSSNILFMSTSKKLILFGFLTFMVHRIICIILTLKLTIRVFILPLVIATMPFLFIFSSLLNLTISPEAAEFYPAAINAMLISVLAGLALSNYVMNDNKVNSWLAISTLLFVALVFLFIFEKYYISNVVFQPISAIVFAFGHYTYYKFVLEAEKSVESEVKQL